MGKDHNNQDSDYEDRITVDPNIMGGKPVVKGTRIPIYLILEFFESGHTIDDILEMYPDLEEKDVKAALHYATDLLKREETHVKSAV
ncbi:MAG: DUF433 domain-containing protein [Thermoplasmatota archaeon]